MIREGVYWDGRPHECELYDSRQKVKQCYNCHVYGHITSEKNGLHKRNHLLNRLKNSRLALWAVSTEKIAPFIGEPKEQSDGTTYYIRKMFPLIEEVRVYENTHVRYLHKAAE